MLENFYLCGIKHNLSRGLMVIIMLWFAWKFLSLWYQTQQILVLLWHKVVVICLKISIFVVSNTTVTRHLPSGLRCDLLENFYLCGIKHNYEKKYIPLHWLWFAWKFLSLWYQTQRTYQLSYTPLVVICLKISIFVVSNTTFFRNI